jgi:hypothetical protein
MIITKLQGGLGNQLFQWATTYALAKKYSTDYKFELSYFRSNQRPLQLHKFNGIKIPEIDQNYDARIVNDDFIYKEIENDSFLDGYWQTEKYFIDVAEEIKEYLLPSPDEKKSLLKKHPILLEECTSLHVRRGDYVGLQNTHPLQPVEYYLKGLDIIKSKHIIVFSDDLNWCIENLKANNLYFVDEPDEIKTLHMMSLCKNNIIANSSFSWWGAWMNPNPNKIVIAPKNWFGHAGPANWSDIYAKNWVVL